MRQYLIIIVAVLTLCPLGGNAQVNAQDVLSRLSSKISSLGNYKVSFLAQVEGRSVEGYYAVSGNRYWMSTTDIDVICDGKSRYEVNHIDKEVLIDKINPNDRNILSNPTRAFDFADDSFTATLNGNGLCEVLTLKPTAKGAAITDIKLSIAKHNGLPTELRYSADGLNSDVVVTVKSFAHDDSVSDASFRFDRSKYLDYELVDFR